MKFSSIWLWPLAAALLQTAQSSAPVTSCSSCRTILSTFQTTAKTGDQALITQLTSLCKTLHAADDDVCDGIMAREGPILAYDLRNMTIPSRTSDLFCLNLFGVCSWPAINMSGTPALSPKPANAVRPNPSGKHPLKVPHISDIHVDLNYTVGASAACNKPICCRAFNGSYAPGNNSSPAGPYGNPNCDSPASLEESMYKAIHKHVSHPAFSIFTGDVADRAVWLVTQEGVTTDLNNAYHKMARIGETYAATGNHDSSPVNSFPPPDLSTADNYTWAYDVFSSDIHRWVDTESTDQIVSQSGSYSVLAKHFHKLRIISLNTNFWYIQNFWLYENTMETDPAGLLKWLASELESAESAGERVWIIGHIPMGSTSVFYDQSYYFDAIVQRYDATIAAMFFGHTHQDEFEISYSNYSARSFDTATMMSYIAPALTPTSGNPTFRVYDVDPETYAVLDFTVYYANISAPTYQTKGPSWEVLYSAKATYGALLDPPYTSPTAELTPAFWHNVTEVFESNHDAFAAYYARKGRGYYNATSLACDANCQAQEICQLRAAQAQYNCFNATPGLNFERRSEGGGTTDSLFHIDHDECGVSPVVKVLSAASQQNLLF